MSKLTELRCDECKALFIFLPCTPVNGDVKRSHPEFCPYCGRESNFGADYRTTFSFGDRKISV